MLVLVLVVLLLLSLLLLLLLSLVVVVVVVVVVELSPSIFNIYLIIPRTSLISGLPDRLGLIFGKTPLGLAYGFRCGAGPLFETRPGLIGEPTQGEGGRELPV